jgi:hypothetical protein
MTFTTVTRLWQLFGRSACSLVVPVVHTNCSILLNTVESTRSITTLILNADQERLKQWKELYKVKQKLSVCSF